MDAGYASHFSAFVSHFLQKMAHWIWDAFAWMTGRRHGPAEIAVCGSVQQETVDEEMQPDGDRQPRNEHENVQLVSDPEQMRQENTRLRNQFATHKACCKLVKRQMSVQIQKLAQEKGHLEDHVATLGAALQDARRSLAENTTQYVYIPRYIYVQLV